MKISIKLFLAFALLVPSLWSCKKDDDESSSKYLTGSLYLDFPTYVQPGYTKTFMIDTLMTVSRDDESKAIGYYFKDPNTGKADTLVDANGEFLKHHYTVTIKDTLANLSITLGAFVEEGYFGSVKSHSFTVVKPGLDGKGSLTGYKLDTANETFVDPRDGKSYYYTTINGTDWMRQNLAWEGAGVAYKNEPAIIDIFGAFYTWEEAQTICPEGWRLPNDADLVALGQKYGTAPQPESHIGDLAGDMMEDIYFNNNKMWEYWRDVKITNASGLSVIPVGYATIEDGEYIFDQIYKYAAFWTSGSKGEQGACRYIYQDKDVVFYGLVSKTDVAMPVRCVRTK